MSDVFCTKNVNSSSESKPYKARDLFRVILGNRIRMLPKSYQ